MYLLYNIYPDCQLFLILKSLNHDIIIDIYHAASKSFSVLSEIYPDSRRAIRCSDIPPIAALSFYNAVNYFFLFP